MKGYVEYCLHHETIIRMTSQCLIFQYKFCTSHIFDVLYKVVTKNWLTKNCWIESIITLHFRFVTTKSYGILIHHLVLSQWNKMWYNAEMNSYTAYVKSCCFFFHRYRQQVQWWDDRTDKLLALWLLWTAEEWTGRVITVPFCHKVFMWLPTYGTAMSCGTGIY